MNRALDPLAAQLLLRAYAWATNMLIAGRSFATDDPALAALLRSFGAHVRPLSGVEGTPASSPVAFALEEDAAPRPGAITVLAPQGVFRAVVAPDGRTITGPGDEGRIEWARAHMPVTEAAARALAPLVAGRRVGLSLVLEPKTAALALMLSEAGARVSVFGWASETREDVAAHLRNAGIPVFADSAASREREWELAREILAQRSEFLLDDGSHLIRLAHDTRCCPGVLDALVGAAEETTSGLRPLRSFDLRIPVLASNDARSKTLFDNAYGTGQSCWTTILDLIDPRGVGAPVAGMSVVVIGYGDVGRGCARFGAA
ncbi:MAG: adenosylhomocysteinase, partial [Actinomyces sp.]|nr:adenosylhomocysteinase [Actinomyces sp.]